MKNQHFFRIRREPYLRKRMGEASSTLGVPCISIADNEIAFLISATDEQVMKTTSTALDKYSALYFRCRVVAQDQVVYMA